MPDLYFHSETFDHSTKKLVKAEYDNCVFQNCDLSNFDLSEYTFVNCKFIGCNLSLAKVKRTSFQSVGFTDCKLLGLLFDTCNTFGLSFSFNNCLLNHSSFFKLKIKKTSFKNCQLQEADFSEADISLSIITNCDLFNSKFENTNLEKADLRSVINFIIDPSVNNIKKAKLSREGLPGLLTKYDLSIEN